MQKIALGLALLVILGGATYLYSRAVPQPTSGEVASDSYAYTCDNGSAFTMTPAADVSQVTLSAGSQGMFSGSVVLKQSEIKSTFFTGTVLNAPVTLEGDGEKVVVTVGTEKATCTPVPDSENAPWNWGDAQSAGSVKPDTILIGTENLMGTWQDTKDPKNKLEFKAGDQLVMWYDGKQVSKGLYVVFNKENAPKIVAFPIEANAVYLQTTMTGSQADTQNFKIGFSADANTLTLTYMDRGGVTTYTRVQ
jgi:hypothetical protein